jgi:DNA polymerase-3 subunit delta
MAKVLAEKNLPTRDYKGFAAALDRLPAVERMWLPQKKTGGVNAYPLFLNLRGAERFSMDGLRAAMESALKADRALVTTGLDHRLVLHRIVAELTAAARKR